MSSWILTAFEPFAGRAQNASAMILDQMRSQVRDRRVTTRLLPVVFETLAEHIAALLDLEPDALILTGETGGRTRVQAERVALNVLDAGRRPDNRGTQPGESPVVAGSPLARAATWDTERVVEVLEAHGVPTEKSYHAGTYACNQALFLALDMAAQRGLDIPIGFLHVPGRALMPDSKAAQLAAALPAVFQALTPVVASRPLAVNGGRP